MRGSLRFAAGDCVETWHRLLNGYTYLPLGTTAHKQGRIAGENAIGGSRAFAGSLGTQVVKVFDLVVARTGINYAEARQAGLDHSPPRSGCGTIKSIILGPNTCTFRSAAIGGRENS
jgi:NADPH-dependent 2,4-dienoyl-CoA reductase/sulfur reductase-like enzyme